MSKFTKKLILSVIAAATLTSGQSALATDLSGWAVSEYQSANEAGLISYSVVSGNLKENITRREFCELAVNLYKKLTHDTDLIVPEVSPFWDTDSVAVAQAYCYGIVSGTSEGTFTPDRLVTREEMAKMIVSTLTASEADFALSDGTDTSVIDSFADGYTVSDWAKTSVITVLNYALMNGVNVDQLSPSGATTREQAIASINRSYNAFGESDYSISVPQISLQNGTEIEEGVFDLSWTPTDGAVSYRVLIKDSNANPVIWEDVYSPSAQINAPWMIANKDYSIIVGATLYDGSECYSIPVDFRYKAAKKYIAENPKGQALIDTAAQYEGVPYLWGGSTPAGFDCSGFVQYVCRQNGISIARVADDQLHQSGVYVPYDQLQAGDLVFFGSGNYASHVGMYVGNGMMIHAPSTGKNIMYTSIESSYYSSRYIGAKRVY